MISGTFASAGIGSRRPSTGMRPDARLSARREAVVRRGDAAEARRDAVEPRVAAARREPADGRGRREPELTRAYDSSPGESEMKPAGQPRRRPSSAYAAGPTTF